MSEHKYTTPEERDKFLVGCIQVVKTDGDNKQSLLGIQAELTQLRADNERLRVELLKAADTVEEWGGYVSAYYTKKWDLKGDVAKIKAAAKEPPHA